jgi:hypothetical protein
VAFPKLDNEALIQRLRERYSSWFYELRPHIPVVQPFTPLTIDEVQRATDYFGQVRRRLHAFAVSFNKCVAVGDSLLLPVQEGQEQLARLRHDLLGGEPLALAGMASPEPALWLGQVRDPAERSAAIADANRIGRTLGVVDSLALVRGAPDGSTRLVLGMPFGVGRVDLFDRFPA